MHRHCVHFALLPLLLQWVKRVLVSSSSSGCVDAAIRDCGIEPAPGISGVDVMESTLDALVLSAEECPVLLTSHFDDILLSSLELAYQCMLSSVMDAKVQCAVTSVLVAL
jgi:hypothetical protein